MNNPGSIEGFRPLDLEGPAPDRLPSAVEAFTPPLPAGVMVDPLGALTDREREAHQTELRRLVHAQEEAVRLTSLDLRAGRLF